MDFLYTIVVFLKSQPLSKSMLVKDDEFKNDFSYEKTEFFIIPYLGARVLSKTVGKYERNLKTADEKRLQLYKWPLDSNGGGG